MQDTVAQLSKGQREYEARRAAKAGMTLEQWMARKATTRAHATLVDARQPQRGKRGLLARLLGRFRHGY
ncbi:MAG TPA: hypothetical protein VEY95_00815 [Azospirillaceae bacterium]|nr:hypothetical protein [Azospirillaceae bacterium]